MYTKLLPINLFLGRRLVSTLAAVCSFTCWSPKVGGITREVIENRVVQFFLHVNIGGHKAIGGHR
jgi:hypothetical protein